MTETEHRVAEIMGHYGRKLTGDLIRPETAMAQDAYVDGIDVDDFAAELANVFGPVVYEIPWDRFSDQRASFRGCLQILALPLWLLARLFVRPAGEQIFPVPGSLSHPRLTVTHIATVIDQGFWIEPADLSDHYRTPIA